MFTENDCYTFADFITTVSQVSLCDRISTTTVPVQGVTTNLNLRYRNLPPTYICDIVVKSKQVKSKWRFNAEPMTGSMVIGKEVVTVYI